MPPGALEQAVSAVDDTTPPEQGTFLDFDFHEQLRASVEACGYTAPTPIQAQAIPELMAGRDVIGRARTGSGKTAAFGLPILHRLLSKEKRAVSALILTPTRELALQVSNALKELAPASCAADITTIYGGVSYTTQLRALRRGTPIVVGTPGRLLDLVNRGSLDLSAVDMFVLDEADEMLKMGFIDDVETLLSATPDSRQVALFSATMPTAIQRVADRHLNDPVVVQVEAHALTTSHIEQRWIQVRREYKPQALIRVLLGEKREATLVFARTREDTEAVADRLIASGIPAEALHGGLNQHARERILSRLRAGVLDVLVATDVAARGIDVDHITHVINFALPESDEQYVHRIGRTGRAGRNGVAISLVTSGERRRLFQLRNRIRARVDPGQVPSIKDIQQQRYLQMRDQIQAVLDVEMDDAQARLAVLQEGGLDAEQIAAAALHLLAKHIDVPIPPDPRPRPAPAMPARQQASGPRQGHSGARKNRSDRSSKQPDPRNAVTIFLSIGRRQGTRPGDLVGALTNEGGITSAQIGQITIMERKSFVSMTEPAARKVLADLKQVQIRGWNTRLSLARQGITRH